MRQLYALAFVLLVWGASSFLPVEEVRVLGGLGEATERSLMAYDVPTRWEEQVLVIQVRDRKAVVAALARGYATANFCQSVVSNNLANVRTTKTANGEPYRRQVAVVAEDGQAGGVLEDESDWRWVYDPGNPESEQVGSHRGYVAMPNVNRHQEETAYRDYQDQKESVEQVMQRVDPGFVFSDRGKRSWPKADPVEAPKVGAEKFRSLCALYTAAGQMENGWLVPQNRPSDAGVASVASALNRLAHKRKYTAEDVFQRHQFRLLRALNTESRALGYHWKDMGDLSPDLKGAIVQTLQMQRPVIIAFNGELAPDAMGHIVTLCGFEKDRFLYHDPKGNTIKSVSWDKLLQADQHPDGNFVFMPFPLEENLGELPLS